MVTETSSQGRLAPREDTRVLTGPDRKDDTSSPFVVPVTNSKLLEKGPSGLSDPDPVFCGSIGWTEVKGAGDRPGTENYQKTGTCP